MMLETIKMIEVKSEQVLRRLKTVFNKDFPPDVLTAMTEWADKYNLNLVHYAILYNLPKVLYYLLYVSGLFPEDSQPLTSPYAHLAAFLGRTDSLKMILSKRPGDFFKSRIPRHNITLPEHLVKRLELSKLQTKTEKYVNVAEVIYCFYYTFDLGRLSLVDVPDDVDILVTDLMNKSNQLPSIPPPSQRGRGHVRIINPADHRSLFTNKYKLENEDFLEKTPLTIAAEKGHIDTVFAILEVVYGKPPRNKSSAESPLCMATMAESPEAIVTILEKTKVKVPDYYEAIRGALRELLPQCLIALLYKRNIVKKYLIDGENLFHVLYTKSSFEEESQCEMLPVMTKALIFCEMNLNDRTKPASFPLYSLISRAFTMNSFTKVRPFLSCLEILLVAGANPFYDETVVLPRVQSSKSVDQHQSPVRDAYKSIIHCIMGNVKICGGTPLARLIVRHSFIQVLNYKNVRKKLLPQHLCVYLGQACYVGLDDYIVNKILQCGVNVSIKVEEKYPINFYFDALFSYFWNFKQEENLDFYKQQMEKLMVVCKCMEPLCLRKAVRTVLKQYTRDIPVSVVPITQYFLYLADNLIKERTAQGEDFGIF